MFKYFSILKFAVPKCSLLRLIVLLVLPMIFNFGSAKNSYFPNVEGLSWTYSNGVEQRMTGPYQLDDWPVMVVTQYVDGEIESEEYLVYADNGVFSLGTADEGEEIQRYDPPLIVFEGSSLSIGQSWENKTVFEGLEIRTTYEVVTRQGVKTKSGRYNALVIREESFIDNIGQTVMDIYFVPSIGIVRFLSSDGAVIDLEDKNF